MTGARALDASELAAALRNGACILDLRDAEPFGGRHLHGSTHIKAKSPNFLDRVRHFIPADKAVVLVADTMDDIDWASAQLHGIRQVSGAVASAGLESCGLATDRLAQLDPAEIHQQRAAGADIAVLDVREPDEWAEGCIAGALRIPMYEVPDQIARLPREGRVAIVCAGGQRSSLIASLLKERGFSNDALINIRGGMKAWLRAGLPTE